MVGDNTNHKLNSNMAGFAGVDILYGALFAFMGTGCNDAVVAVF